MGRIQLVILDVEGVLTAAGGSQYPWELAELLAVREFLETAPLAVTLCTGRQAPYGEAVIQALNLFYPLPQERRNAAAGPELQAWPSIFENGCYFYDPLLKRPLPHPALTPERVRSLQRLRTEVLQPLAEEHGAIIEAGKDLSVSLNPPLVPGSHRERESAESFRPVVEAALHDSLDQIEIKHSASAVDLTTRGVSKASAVRVLLEWCGLGPEEVLGVGDTKGDEEWLRQVGWAAAPANGRPNLPGLSYYAEAEAAAGLLQILQHLERNGYDGL
jgi:hydroxymethylpyrimidine pyrophosphatase-like HAD family hydrolase